MIWRVNGAVHMPCALQILPQGGYAAVCLVLTLDVYGLW